MSARRLTTLPAFPPRRFCIRRTEIDCALPIWCYCISERRSKSLRHQGKRALSYRLPWEIDRPSPTRCQTGPRRCCFADARLIPPIPGQRSRPDVFFLRRTVLRPLAWYRSFWRCVQLTMSSLLSRLCSFFVFPRQLTIALYLALSLTLS